MIEENEIEIVLESDSIKFPSNTVGIDMGQSLTKFAHLREGNLYLHYYPTQKNDLAVQNNLDSKIVLFPRFNFTGGKSYDLYNAYSKRTKAKLINEFEANVKGVEVLHLLERKEELPVSLIVTIGTGTSMISKKDSVEHLGGTAMGGGVFMGLLKILFDIGDFEEALNLAKKGNRYNVDLKVSDIYSPEDSRVDKIFREFTAASLGKIDLNFERSRMKKEDFISSLISMIGENIGIIASLMAEINTISDIVFCGGFLRENKIAKRILSLICTVNKKNSIFLKNSEFSAAIGALVS